jgi:hypothetical protein
MNKHFEDARYYLGRAVEHAAEGLREELGPVEERVRELVGAEREPEPTRVERIQSELRELETRATGKSKEAIHSARQQLAQYRGSEVEAVEVEEESEAEAETETESESGTESGEEAAAASE